MKKMMRLVALGLCMSMFTMGCGSKDTAKAPAATDATVVSEAPATATATSDASAKDTSLDDIKKKGEFVLGLDASFPPMGFQNDNLEIVGFDVDLAKEVCKRMGVKLKLQPISWDAKEQELATKNIDCIWNGLSYNEDRAKAMTLSKPYMKNKQVVVVLADSKVKTLKDLSGKIVAIQNGSTASDAMDANPDFKKSLKQLVKVKDNVQALMDMKVSGSDAVAMDEVVARYYTSKEAGKYRILDETLSDEDYVIGFRKGDKALCAEVEKYLSEMKSDGTLAKIAETWFGKDITTVK
jgi:ABC-type amino acid transport/signal transduction systems, periplasmic component/domain